MSETQNQKAAPRATADDLVQRAARLRGRAGVLGDYL